MSQKVFIMIYATRISVNVLFGNSTAPAVLRKTITYAVTLFDKRHTHITLKAV